MVDDGQEGREARLLGSSKLRMIPDWQRRSEEGDNLRECENAERQQLGLRAERAERRHWMDDTEWVIGSGLGLELEP